jgi:hypothetical protein
MQLPASRHLDGAGVASRFLEPEPRDGVDRGMTYRDDLQALVTRHNALDAEVMRNRRERDKLRLLIDDAQTRLRLPVVDNIRPASPCTEDWSKMEGDARARSCARCNQNVYNLSEMTREEAHALLVAREGAVCVRYYRRSDGTILTKDCAVGKQRRRRRRVVAAGLVASIAASLLGYKQSQRPDLPLQRIAVGAANHHAQDHLIGLEDDYYQGGEPLYLKDELRKPPPRRYSIVGKPGKPGRQ